MLENETRRLTSHELSGQVHLLRFCIDELLEDRKLKENSIVKKLSEGIKKLENFNETFRQNSRPFLTNENYQFNEIVERAFFQVKIYARKDFQNFLVECTCEETFSNEDFVNLKEIIFSCFSGIEKVLRQSLKEENHIIIFKNFKREDESFCFELHSNIDISMKEELKKILSFEDFHSKTLRSSFVYNRMNDYNVRIKFLEKDRALGLGIEYEVRNG